MFNKIIKYFKFQNFLNKGKKLEYEEYTDKHYTNDKKIENNLRNLKDVLGINVDFKLRRTGQIIQLVGVESAPINIRC